VVPATPVVSASSTAYTPASGNPSSWKFAAPEPRAGRLMRAVSFPVPVTLCSAKPGRRAAESSTTSAVGASSIHMPSGSSTASESIPAAVVSPRRA